MIDQGNKDKSISDVWLIAGNDFQSYLNSFIKNNNDIDSLKKIKKIFRKLDLYKQHQVLSFIKDNNDIKPRFIKDLLKTFLLGDYTYKEGVNNIVNSIKHFANDKDVKREKLHEYCAEKIKKIAPNALCDGLYGEKLDKQIFLKILQNNHELERYMLENKICVVIFNDDCFICPTEKIVTNDIPDTIAKILKKTQHVNIRMNDSEVNVALSLRKSCDVTNELKKQNIQGCEIFLPFSTGQQKPGSSEYNDCLEKYTKSLEKLVSYIPKKNPIHINTAVYSNYIGAPLAKYIADECKHKIGNITFASPSKYWRFIGECPGNTWIVEQMNSVKNPELIEQITIDTNYPINASYRTRQLISYKNAKHLCEGIYKLNKYNVALIKYNKQDKKNDVIFRVKDDNIGNLKSEQKIEKANKNNKKAQEDGKGNKKNINDNLKKKQRRNILKDKAQKKTVLPEYYKGDDASVITNANSNVLNLNDKNRDIINSQDILPYI